MNYTIDCPPQETNIPTQPCPPQPIAVDPCLADGSTLFHALVCTYSPAALIDWCSVPGNKDLVAQVFGSTTANVVCTVSDVGTPATVALPVTGISGQAMAATGGLGLALVVGGSLLLRRFGSTRYTG